MKYLKQLKNTKTYMDKLIQLINEIENLEDFIKISSIDFKIDIQTTNEILRITQQAKERALK